MGWRLAHLPVLLAATGGLLAVATVAGWALQGGAGAAGAAAGVGMVAGSYLVSTLVLAWADSVNPSLVLPFGLLTYVVKYTLLGIVMVAVAASGWAGLPAMGLGIAAGIVTWIGTHIWWVVRHPPRLEYPDRRVAED